MECEEMKICETPVDIYIVNSEPRPTPPWVVFTITLYDKQEFELLKRLYGLLKKIHSDATIDWKEICWKAFAIILIVCGNVVNEILPNKSEELLEIAGNRRRIDCFEPLQKLAKEFLQQCPAECQIYLESSCVYITAKAESFNWGDYKLARAFKVSGNKAENVLGPSFGDFVRSASVKKIPVEVQTTKVLFGDTSSKHLPSGSGTGRKLHGNDREWLLKKLAHIPITKVVEISHEEYCDRLLLRLHLNEPLNDVYDNFLTLFGYEYDETIHEILEKWPEIRRNTQPVYAPFLIETPQVSPRKPIVEFSMRYNEPPKATISKSSNTKKNNTQKQKEDSQYNMQWLVDMAECLPLNDLAENHRGLADMLLTMLQSPNSDDDLMQQLTELFGYDSMEVLFNLVQHRIGVVNSMKIKTQPAPQKLAVQKKLLAQSKPRPTIASQIIVQSAGEKRLQKEIRKEEKKMRSKQTSSVVEDEQQLPMPWDYRLSEKQQQLEQLANAPIFSKPQNMSLPRLVPSQEKYRFVFRNTNIKNYGTLLLAEGTEIISTPNYKQVDIPANKGSIQNVLPADKKIKISSLDERARIIFADHENLNVIQSIVYESAYTTNENLLICAPTGAGKTNIALLTIAKCLQPYMVGNKVQDNNFKIVYVAPMKALASEMTANFSKKLRPVGVKVRELTGDMQLSKHELLETHILVTTPEKWDIVTRKPDSETGLSRLVRLLIIDEIHLLNGDRGHVLEALVARTLRLVESIQLMTRIVGLSATLPNFIDIARFLQVNLQKGLFYFDDRFRPVPLATTFIGYKETTEHSQITQIDTICYDQVIRALRDGHQVMVFVHTRHGTVQTAQNLRILAQNRGTLSLFEPKPNAGLVKARQTMSRSNNRDLRELFQVGLSVHNAGILRSDRNHVERFFMEGHIRVLVTTATLAWGINLPVHTVIIKGTDVYINGQNTNVDILDVQQIFGRAGRPQFDTSGHAIIITQMKNLDLYLRQMTNQIPIESRFLAHLVDDLNAEVVLGNVTTVQEAVTWLSYTYLYIRMRINPLIYGINYYEMEDDPNLVQRRRAIINDCARKLDSARLIRYNADSGDLITTDYGRIASHFYIRYNTIELFNNVMAPIMTESDIMQMITRAQEFDQIRVREDEIEELQELLEYCELHVTDVTTPSDKVNILLQSFLSRSKIRTSSLIADMNYAIQNVPRLARGLFEIYLRSNNALMAGKMLKFALMFDNHQWDFENPIRQFGVLSFETLNKIEKSQLSVEKMKDMDVAEIGAIIRNRRDGMLVKKCADNVPLLNIETSLMPITRTVLRIALSITARFQWDVKIHGTLQPFWLWIEDPNSNNIYHYEYFVISRKIVLNEEAVKLFLTIPLQDPKPSQYIIRITSDRWLGAFVSEAITFNDMLLPSNLTRETDLEDLTPLCKTVLNNSAYEDLYTFDYLNPIQTQMFYVLYHTDQNILLGAPTGSGKTIIAEFAILRLFNNEPNRKVIYVAPLKALVRERVADWQSKFSRIGKKVVEVTGDIMPDKRTLEEANIIITTPEKWDIVSRNWESRSYVQAVGLLILDEVHLLGEDRGPVLEAIVSRTNFIASRHEFTIRMMGLSTAMANAYDLADWLGVKEAGLYNFRPATRPVPLEVHISGYPGKHYCPRMALMNKPTFQAIREHAPRSPAIVFVSSRRQTRVTALDLISFLSTESDSKQWLHMDDMEMEYIIRREVVDENLKHVLLFGIGVHHAGLLESDRKLVEELFYNQKIQVIIATATLAWGVNFPAHLVVIKGTEYYDGKQRRYIDMPITDVLQMMGRAGRPQFDETGVAVVLVHDIKKLFYKKFLYEPFPVESHMLDVLPNHLSAEIAAGTVTTRRVAFEYITWTYLYRRLINNPGYYQLHSLEPRDIYDYVFNLVASTVDVLVEHECCTVAEDGESLQTTIVGRVGANFYLAYQSVKFLTDVLNSQISTMSLLRVLCDTYEFSQVPVRHNEDFLNENLARECKIPVRDGFDSAHTKTYLLLQAHFSHLEMPCSDYSTDLKLILEQTGRVLQAIIEYSCAKGWLETAARCVFIIQMLTRAMWIDESPFLQIPYITPRNLPIFDKISYPKHPNIQMTFAGLVIHSKKYSNQTKKLISSTLPKLLPSQSTEIINFLNTIQVPLIKFRLLKTRAGQLPIEIKHTHGIFELQAEEFYTLEVSLHCAFTKGLSRPKHVPHSRKKGDSWSIMFGCTIAANCIPPVVIKKVIATRTQKTFKNNLRFVTPAGHGKYPYCLMVMSDSYIGLDQEFKIGLHIQPSRKSS